MPKRSSIPLRKRVFLGCEGESERGYGVWLHFLADDIDSLHLHIDPFIPGTGGGDPLSVVERSIKEMRRRAKQEGYIARGILLDGDRLGEDRARDQRAAALARTNDVDLIFQDPDHEAFLLHHFPGCETLHPPKGNSERELKAVWPEYEKPMGRVDLQRKLSIDDLRRACTVELAFRAFLTKLEFPLNLPQG